jgi:hypothetical protein
MSTLITTEDLRGVDARIIIQLMQHDAKPPAATTAAATAAPATFESKSRQY